MPSDLRLHGPDGDVLGPTLKLSYVLQRDPDDPADNLHRILLVTSETRSA